MIASRLRFAGALLDSSAAGSKPPFLINEDENDLKVKHYGERNPTVQTYGLFLTEAYSDRDKSNLFSLFFPCLLFCCRTETLWHWGPCVTVLNVAKESAKQLFLPEKLHFSPLNMS